VEGRLYPALVGNDIGCGVGLWETSLSKRKGKRDVWTDRLKGLDVPWQGDTRAWLSDRGVSASGFEQGLGTIGGGNHFAELQLVEIVEDAEEFARLGLSDEAIYLLVHSGSRGFGEAILREHVERFGFAALEVGSGEAGAYLARHDHAVNWAAANRELIAARMLEQLGAEGRRRLDVCHNGMERQEVGGRPVGFIARGRPHRRAERWSFRGRAERSVTW